MADIAQRRYLPAIATDIYISTMLLLFPLFTGFSGYGNITFSKYLFFIIATALWLCAAVILSVAQKSPLPTLALPQYAAMAFAACCLISFLLSPHKGESLIGAGRYEGLITQLMYALIIIGVSLWGKASPHHIICLGISTAICSVIGIIQLFNIDVFRLFLGTYSHYDSTYKYSGAFLGTMGNTNVLSAFYCLALPMLFVYPIISRRRISFLTLLALCPATFAFIRIWVSGGFLALGLCALIAAPIILTDVEKLRRALFMAAPVAASAACAFAFNPSYDLVNFSWSFDFSGKAALMIIAALISLAAGAILPRLNIRPRKNSLRIFLICICIAALILGLIFVYFSPAAEGTVYELRELLHGRIDEKFGSSRILIWRECLKLFPEYPLFGSGPDTLALRVNVSFSRFVEETGKTLRSGVDNAHNEYLGYLINIGLVGLCAYLFILALGLKNWLKKLFRPEICAMGAAMLCYCIQSFFALGLPLVSPLFLIVLALLCSGERKYQKEMEEIK
ncbi:MAG: O-antigen ligase family protein [Oscillospiraceae bacterium]|nr:O-antigen ligase family protein [Oscillospiraceae bacterium]